MIHNKSDRTWRGLIRIKIKILKFNFFELLGEVVVKQAIFQLIDGLPGLEGEFFQPDPDQERTADMIALNTCRTTLTVFKPGQL